MHCPETDPTDPCGCHPASLPRRDFLKWSASALGALALARLPSVAGPFTRADFERLVPVDKKLSAGWLKSLFARGERAVYRGPELARIGLPIGGIGCGQLYLGGDGKLWHWDIFNRHIGTGAEHYAKPMSPVSPLEQGFAVRWKLGDRTEVRPLDSRGWDGITFNGEYPLASVEYHDSQAPIHVALEAFSPFIPLNVEDSSLPVTVLRFAVKNVGAQPLEVDLAGWLENAVCLDSGGHRTVLRRNRAVKRNGYAAIECRAEPPPEDPTEPQRPDILFDDFERETYDRWLAEGTAFGAGPVAQDAVPGYQGHLGGHGQRVVNSHASAPGADVGARDAQTGTLTSPPFRLERHYVTFLIGGGSHAGKTCANLLVDGKTVLSATGSNENRMHPHSWDVRKWAGQTAVIQVVDAESGGWGNIGIDHIVLSDRPRVAFGPLAEEPDFGTMALALLEAGPDDRVTPGLKDASLPAGAFAPADTAGPDLGAASSGSRPVGSLNRHWTLAPSQTAEAVFVVSWYFPNLKMDRLPPGRHYGTRFRSALAVTDYVAQQYAVLSEQTHRWHDTWYDSSLPYWFLDRTFLNASILATSTTFRFANGRFWGWEGVGCCHGTCGHVWQYAHAVARLFPQLERDTRERVDFGLAQQPDGAIFFRAEFNDIPAIDAQAGSVLRALREHQMTADNSWLKRNWPGIRKAIEWLIAKDADGDGLITGNQHNTLDTDWFGPVAWLSGLYLAALRAGETMAATVGDHDFGRRCRAIFDRGQPKLVAELFDGDYFINRPDPQHLDAINSGTGCHIDQVFGQSWAFQVGLDRVLPEKETVAALKSLWRYNFTPDVGPYRDAYKPGRWYAMPGEGGLLMCSFPRQDWDYAQAKGKGPEWAAGYFNECMNGFEYQAAGHMIWEGLVQEGLAITRMVHDRYHPLRRNPWNEIECGDHYARSMASYGVYLAACGYTYDGPQAQLGFAPRITPEDFKCAFTAAEGWGSYSQRLDRGQGRYAVTVRWGRLRLATLSVPLPAGANPTTLTVTAAGKTLPATHARDAGRLLIHCTCDLQAGETLEIVAS